jgi:Kyakuja-Dileera-Zisupton transposase
MLAFDGNNSLKRVATTGDRAIGDDRIFEDSDYFLPQKFVDQFAEEVGSTTVDNSNNATLQHDNDDGQGVGDGCPARTWTAAGEKGTWGIFKESGLFASACRHGLILWIIDMIQSGEL